MHIYIILCHHIFCSQYQKLFLCADKCDKHRCEHCGYYDCLETEKCMWTSESDDGWMAEGPYGVCKPKGNNRLCNKGRAQQKSICHLKGLLKTLSYKINFRAHKYFSSSFPSSTRVTLGSDVTLHPYGHSVFINV